MYKVLIVDDEAVIRNGISAIIDWEKEEMLVEDHYANGTEALTAMSERSFDILITDVKMPLMDGIQLTKRALELYPWLKVILISHYSDFEYVKEGLKVGAADYLLKLTLNRDELLAVLRRCVSLLEEERKRALELNYFRQSAAYRKRKGLEQEIKRRIVQKRPSSLATGWAPAWMDRRYACVYLTLDKAEEWIENYGYLYVHFLLEEIQEAFYEHIAEGAAMLAADSSLFLVVPDNEGDSEKLILEWKSTLEAGRGISTSAGTAVKQGIHHLLKGFADCRSACQRRFFEGLGGLYPMKVVETGVKAYENTYIPNDWTLFSEMIRSGDPVSSAIELALERWKNGTLNPEQVRQEACELLAGVHHLHPDSRWLLPHRQDMLLRTETLEQLSSYLTGQLEEIRQSLMPALADNGYGGQLITKALEYISAHYTGNLTLQSAADSVHLSKSYFSLYFKKQTGRNFIDYLIELRIREAKRLLAQNDIRIYDVAEAAGFKDVKYFCKAFKKVTGLTPLEYREKHQVTGSYVN
ncbi:response regulator transcription factor [Paenibacillus sp. URB8-2]|uniref:response regulator transcription factor n=1 Tax=Paenibacillus sp. URB8-2 TaxID=2741301 RepID=UPI0015BCAAFA|nr:response regulator [Paenibacillus sp. URB8-2]BCG61460.1 hypothetical protein PUR_48850 [Paenibacillus sp. URB8-2]